MIGSIFGTLVSKIGTLIAFIFKKVVIPAIPLAMYAIIIITVLTFCFIIAGVGGSFVFYVIIFFYIKALFDYNPVEEAKKKALAEQQMMQQ